MKIKLGLIINPVAGLGGRVALKGSDGEMIQRRALELGAVPLAGERTKHTLKLLLPLREHIQFITYPGEMGAFYVQSFGFDIQVIGKIETGKTTAQDTKQAAHLMKEIGVNLLLFAGGDGTARDIYDAVGTSLPVLGIPAGVKIQSAAFAISPSAAGELIARLVQGEPVGFREAEVLDLDETEYRNGKVSPRLYGYLSVPFVRQLIQSAKSPSPPNDQLSVRDIACYIVDQMQLGIIYILGPGTTTRAITTALGLEKTLLGVDIILNKELLARDVNERQLLKFLTEFSQRKLIITPIGGQGYLFGRGNQQISPAVIQAVGRENILVVSTLSKILSLQGKPFLVDSGSEEIDRLLRGYFKVITGYNQHVVYRVD